MRKRFVLLCGMTALMFMGSPSSVAAAARQKIEPDKTITYKKVGEVKLDLHVFNPGTLKPGDKRPAIVFFFGGGWAGGSPKQFYQQAKAFAALGLVALSAEYRVSSKHKTTPFECVQDGKSAIRWVRRHAAELGVDPSKIIAAGGSAGGHVAACTGVIEGHEEEGEELAVSSLPNAMILYNPVIDTTEKGYGVKRVGLDRKTEISPCHHVRKGIPPTLIFHGTADGTVRYENVERFTKLMKAAGNTCTLVPFFQRGHGFFNGALFRASNGDHDFNTTMRKSAEFLTTLRFPFTPPAPEPATSSVPSELALNGIFTDHMVLQRDMPVAVYGKGVPGETVAVAFTPRPDSGQAGQRKSAVVGKAGNWLLKLDAMKASAKPAVMTVKATSRTLTLEDILVGDVWVCSGQSNMGFCMGAYGSPVDREHFRVPLLREFHVDTVLSMKPETQVKCTPNHAKVRAGKWVVCSPESGNCITAVGLYFGRKVVQETGIPIGLIKAAVGGTRIEPWISPEGAAMVPEVPPVGRLPDIGLYKGGYPATWHCLYNGMIHPITRFGIKGALWYQGESNGNEGISYFHKKRALIGGWRKAWDQGDPSTGSVQAFPFYFVQLAAFQRPGDNPAGGGWAPCRMAQLKSLSIPNTGMAVAIDLNDVDNPNNIHPFDKKSVGERLALWCLAKDYPSTTLRAGGKAADLVYSGPLYRGMKIEGDKIRISFDHVGSGLIIASRKGGFQPLVRDPKGKLQRFAIAGKDKKWFWANAIIDGKTVVVSSPDVPKPVAVRYAFEQNPEGSNLYNEEGLTASPFCTDDWLMK